MIPSTDTTGGTDRRGFLLLGFGGLLLHLVLAGIASIRYLVPNVLYEPLRVFKLKKPEDYPDNALTFVEEQKVFLVKKSGGIRSVSAVCTHLGCTVNWSEASGKFLCPCHGSKFDPDGKNISGPAPSPLIWYDVSLGKDGRIVVNMDLVVGPDRMLKA